MDCWLSLSLFIAYSKQKRNPFFGSAVTQIERSPIYTLVKSQSCKSKAKYKMNWILLNWIGTNCKKKWQIYFCLMAFAIVLQVCAICKSAFWKIGKIWGTLNSIPFYRFSWPVVVSEFELRVLNSSERNLILLPHI